MKKILIWILCFSLLIPYTAIFADEEQGNDSDIIFCDFETEQPFSKNESASYAKADDEHGMVLKLETNSSDNSQTVRYAEYRDLGITAEKVLCSFDFKLFQANNNFTFMLRNDAGGVICRMQFKNTGTIYVTNDGVNTKKTEIVPNEWCTAKILLDFNRKTIEASINNVYMNEITMAMVDSESISGAYMGVWQQGNDAKLYVDNVAFADYSDKGSLRDELNEETGIVFVSENIGNIYFDKSPTFTTRVYNDSQSNADFEITTRVVSESGRVVLQDTQVASIGAGSDHDIDYRVSVDYFGFYNVYLTAVNKVTGEEYSKTTVFSVVNTPKNGKVNPIMGVADHIINKKAGYNVMDKKVELMAKAGLSFYREEYNWTDYRT